MLRDPRPPRLLPTVLVLAVTGSAFWCCPADAHRIPSQPTELAADHFDTDIHNWTGGFEVIEWKPFDAAGSDTSGSMLLAGHNMGLRAGGTAFACVAGVAPGTAYQVRAHVYNDTSLHLGPRSRVEILFWESVDCSDGPAIASVAGRLVSTPNSWQEARADATAPEGAQSMTVSLTWGGVPGDRVYFDDVVLLSGVEQPPVPDGWLQSPAFPLFKFQVRISDPAGGSRLGTLVSDCIADAVCFGGARPDRPELEVRLTGPRPNGYVWPAPVQLTPSEVEVWIEKLDTGELRYYQLPAATPGQDQLGGFFDRRGFLPPLR